MSQITDDYNLSEELDAVKTLLQLREVRAKGDNNLLILTWNIELLGSRKRSKKDYKLISEMIRPFDIAAIQETKSNLSALRAIMDVLNEQDATSPFKLVVTDIAGLSPNRCFVT